MFNANTFRYYAFLHCVFQCVSLFKNFKQVASFALHIMWTRTFNCFLFFHKGWQTSS